MMTNLNLVLLTLACYLAASICQALRIFKKINRGRVWVFSLGCIAIILQSYLLYRCIDLQSGQNLGVLNVLAMVTWLGALLLLITGFTKPVANLFVLAFPLAAVFLLFSYLFPSSYVINTDHNPKELIHILLSIVTFSVMIIAALQAIFLAWQERQLRQKKALVLLQVLPPIETMEYLLFRIIAVGFILLSAVLVTSVLFFHHIFTTPLLHKTILTCIAWLVFAVLLWGRAYFGWRGPLAIRCTLAGVGLVLLAYLSSQVLAAWLG